MSGGQAVLLAVVIAVGVGAVLGLSARLVGQVAERFGEEPRYWQLRMLPFTVFGPVVLWLILSRRGGRGGFA